MPKPVLVLNFNPPPADKKAESKNYDIVVLATNSPDGKCPLLISNKGDLYLKKGLINPAKAKGIKIEVTVET